jgi:hypothetical protein
VVVFGVLSVGGGVGGEGKVDSSFVGTVVGEGEVEGEDSSLDISGDRSDGWLVDAVCSAGYSNDWDDVDAAEVESAVCGSGNVSSPSSSTTLSAAFRNICVTSS